MILGLTISFLLVVAIAVLYEVYVAPEIVRVW